MKLSPAKPYDGTSATAKARELHPGAFAKYSADSAKHSRCQILLEHNGVTGMAACGPDWVEALAQFYEWAQAHGEKYGARLPEESHGVEKQAEGEGRGEAGGAGGEAAGG